MGAVRAMASHLVGLVHGVQPVLILEGGDDVMHFDAPVVIAVQEFEDPLTQQGVGEGAGAAMLQPDNGTLCQYQM